MTRAVVLLPGDGIGRVVVPAAVRVLEAAGFAAHWVPAEIGWDCWARDGEALPTATLELVRRHGVALLGAITSRSHREAQEALPPALRGRRYRSPVLELRGRLGLEVSVRPCRTLSGLGRNFVRRDGDELVEPRIDVDVVMQNTLGHYAGLEWTDPPPPLRAALDAHPAMAPLAAVPSSEIALSCRVLERGACARVADAAFAHAARAGKRSVTVVDKWGVMGDTAELMLEAAEAAAARHPGIELRRANVNAQALRMTTRPEADDVLLCEALLGDILSDGYAGLVGGLGFVPCANLGRHAAVFEPMHGSAPRHAKGTPPMVNPIAAILAGAMLAEHTGHAGVAARIRAAVAAVVWVGQVRTFDMLGPDRARAATTDAMTDAIIAAL